MSSKTKQNVPKRRKQRKAKTLVPSSVSKASVRKTKKEVVRNVLGQTMKQARGDPRLGKTKLTNVDVVATAQNAIPISVPLPQRNLTDFAMGYVTKALEKGFATTASNGWDPYFALIYLIRLLQQFSSNSTPPVVKLPYVVLAMGRALTSKTVGFANGQISYTMVNDTAPDPMSSILIGYSSYGFQYFLGYVPPTPTLTNVFPNLTFAGFPAYTEEQGAAAFSEMNTFLTLRLKDNPDFRMVNLQETTIFDKDCAAFSIIGNAQGLGSGDAGSGGFGALAQLEVPIFRPLLTLLNAANAPPASLNRYPNLIQNVAGDATMIGALAGTTIPLKEFGMKRCPKLHPIDFLSLMETVAMWVSSLQQNAIDDPENLWQGGGQQQDPSGLLCPLTLQELSLLVRNACMDALKDTQAGVQGLYPFIPTSGIDNQFVPFTASAGTCFLQSVPFDLPLLLVENIRAFTYREVHRTATDKEFFIPVLGQNFSDVLNPSNYTYTYKDVTTGVETTYPSFTVPTAAEIRTQVWDAKSQSMKEMLVPEVVISYVDGSASGGIAVAINNPQTLTMLAGTWDMWLKQKTLSTYAMTLTPFSAEKGINILCAVNMTRHWVTSGGGVKEGVVARGQGSIRHHASTRFETKRHQAVLASPYLNRLAVADTAQSTPLTQPYTEVLSLWELPLIENEFAGPNDDTLVGRWQALMSEPYLLNSSSGFDGNSLADLHFRYAQHMVKSRNSPPGALENFLVEAAAQGRGGLLASLIGGAVKAFAPGASSIVDTIASFVPF